MLISRENANSKVKKAEGNPSAESPAGAALDAQTLPSKVAVRSLGFGHCFLPPCLAFLHQVPRVLQELHASPSQMPRVISMHHITSYKAFPKFSHTGTVNSRNDAHFRNEDTDAQSVRQTYLVSLGPGLGIQSLVF